MKLSFGEKIVLQLFSSALALFDVALLYLVIDLGMEFTLTWGVVLVAWWILETVHYSDFARDAEDGKF